MLAFLLYGILFFDAVYWLAHPISLLFFSYYRSEKGQKRARWRCFVASTVNAFVCCGYSIWSIYVTGRWDNYIPDLHEKAAAFIAGYFLHDLVISIVFKTIEAVETLHHCFALVLLSMFFVLPCYNPFFIGYIVVEGSTPFYNFTWHSIKCKAEDKIAAKISQYAFAIAFFLLRVVWFPFVAWTMTHFGPCHQSLGSPYCYAVPLICWAVYCLQLFWFSKILKQVLGVLGIAFTSQVQKKLD